MLFGYVDVYEYGLTKGKSTQGQTRPRRSYRQLFVLNIMYIEESSQRDAGTGVTISW